MGGSGFRHQGKVIWPGFNSITQRHVVKVGRNDPCPCGSGKKYKDCHERKGDSYLHKLTIEHDRKRLEELRAARKAEGVSWLKRLLRRS
jgi:hypothetical protein